MLFVRVPTAQDMSHYAMHREQSRPGVKVAEQARALWSFQIPSRAPTREIRQEVDWPSDT